MQRSSQARFIPLIWLLTLAVAAVCGVLAGCEKSPEMPTLANPFDPDGPTGGDGLQIAALASVNQIVLSWNQPQNMDIVEYFLYHSDTQNGTFEDLAVVEHTDNASGNYIYDYPDPTQTHWFKAQAFTQGGDFTLTSLAVAATATVGPTVIVGDTVSFLATRFPEFTVTASFGDSLLVGHDETFANAARFAAAGPGLPTVFSLDLGPAALDSNFTFYVKAFDDLRESLPTVRDLKVGFGPRHGLVDASPLRLATRVNDLQIPALGVLRMRFAASEAGLAGTAWVPGAEIHPGYELSDLADFQEIWGEFEGDFGYNTTHKLIVRPNLLGDAAFKLKVPDTRIVSTPTVSVELSAAATDLRISENPNFAAVPWQPYVPLLDFTLSAGEGTKTVYVQYRNDWTQSAILSDYCIFVSQGLDVKIFAPVTGNALIGGSTFIIGGTSNPGTVAATIDSVKLDLGDGQGFRAVSGIDSWKYTWGVPTFDEDTELVLRARAWADSARFMVTDVVTVTVTQLVIKIVEPLAGTTVTGGDPVTVAGTAIGLLGGAPMDSVVVDIGTEHLAASGTDTWSVTWTAPVVTVNTPTDIIATVWAGGESVSQTISVTVTP